MPVAGTLPTLAVDVARGVHLPSRVRGIEHVTAIAADLLSVEFRAAPTRAPTLRRHEATAEPAAPAARRLRRDRSNSARRPTGTVGPESGRNHSAGRP